MIGIKYNQLGTEAEKSRELNLRAVHSYSTGREGKRSQLGRMRNKSFSMALLSPKQTTKQVQNYVFSKLHFYPLTVVR
jgi:hypothetical protein